MEKYFSFLDFQYESLLTPILKTKIQFNCAVNKYCYSF